ncbi:3-deoxy-D-manno-octulosonic acid transferase [Psychrobacter sp. 1Y11]|uniref:3-deoxy-D-manno-octulosonic acid transferase n=1 Tax=Psychrobacter sp. 1Y11 TaxID=3457446 RepID=UPI003FD68F17
MSSSFVAPPWYYRVAIAILKPLYRMQVWHRSHKRDNYQEEVAQRFGKTYPAPPQPSQVMTSKQAPTVIWCHAVSLGETNTAAPLLDALMAKGYAIWLTNTTQTGFARGAKRFADDIAQGRLSHSYVPVDSPVVIERFLTHVQPIAALFIETELWATILSKLSERRIPSILVNGRLSLSSFNSYQKIGAVSASMMQNLSLIIAQDNQSAKRFRQLGASSAQIRVAGSLKWVINTPTSAKQAEPDATNIVGLKTLNRPLWVAASTHEGEEEAALSMQQRLLADTKLANTLLIIVPRHPERFDEVADLIKARSLTLARRSLDEPVSAQTQVYLADTMGELMHWYQQADVALVGGSLVDIGGHNPVEPASVATPILMGQYTQSCQSVVDKLAEVGALYQPNNEHYHSDKGSLPVMDAANNSISNSKMLSDNELIYQQLAFWLNHLSSAKSAGQAGAQMTAEQQSVLEQQLTMIEQVVEQSIDKAVYE